MDFLELHMRSTKIIKIKLFLQGIIEIMKFHNVMRGPENHENLIIQSEDNENLKIHRNVIRELRKS